MARIAQLSLLLLFTTFSLQAAASTITYSTQNLPILFSAINLENNTYDVSVIWEKSFNQVYGTGADYDEPFFMGERISAWGAANALLQSLIDDNYQVRPHPSFISIPYNLTPSGFDGAGLSLNHLSGLVSTGLYSRGLSLSHRGYTQWSLAEIPLPPTTWLLSMGLAVMLGLRWKSYP